MLPSWMSASSKAENRVHCSARCAEEQPTALCRRRGWSRRRGRKPVRLNEPAAPKPSLSLGSLLRQGGLGLLHVGGESRRLVDGQFGQELAIDLDPSLAETIDKSGIGQAMQADRSVETLDPESAESALLGATVASGILHALLDRLLGDADRVLAAAVEAF